MNTLALPYKSFWWREILRRGAMRIMGARQEYGIGSAVVNDNTRMEGARVTGPNVITNCHFTDPDGTLLTAYTWTDPLDVRPGINQWVVNEGASLVVISNTSRPPAFGIFSNRINTTQADVTITANFFTGVLGGTRQYGVIFRATDVNNYWNAAWLSNLSSLRIYETTGGITIARASVGLGMPIATTTLFTIVLSGSNISLTVTYPTISVTLTHISAVRATVTNHGIRGVDINAPISAYWDNFMVTVP